MDPELYLHAYQKADNKRDVDIGKHVCYPGPAEESLLFEGGCPTSQLMLLPYQRAQASLSTGAGRFGLSSAEARRMSACVETWCLRYQRFLFNLRAL